MLFRSGKQNAYIDRLYYCPHHTDSGFKGEIRSLKFNCDCRKPKPGMLLSAKTKHNIDMENSWMIGDRENDIKAANNAGIINTILVKSGHKVDEFNSKSKFTLDSIKDIHQAIKY